MVLRDLYFKIEEFEADGVISIYVNKENFDYLSIPLCSETYEDMSMGILNTEVKDYKLVNRFLLLVLV